MVTWASLAQAIQIFHSELEKVECALSHPIPARDILTKSHKGQILRMFLIGTETIQCEIYRVHVPTCCAVHLIVRVQILAMQALDSLEKHLFQIKDVELIVLKGHLILEEELNNFLACFVNDTETFLKIGFTFERTISLLCSLVPKQMAKDEIWEQLREINRLRNKLAHNLRFSLYEQQLKSWGIWVLGYNPKTLKRKVTYRNTVVKAFALLTGHLSGLAKGYSAAKELNSNPPLNRTRATTARALHCERYGRK